MNLYLVRHAVAFGRDRERWPNDAERPLTPEGEDNFRKVAHGLALVVPEVEVVLSSPYVRAWRTAELLEEQTDWPAPGIMPALEPDVPPEKVVLALETYARAESIALVGHRPCLHELASYLLTGSEDAFNFGLKKGGAAYLEFKDTPETGSGKLRWLLTPRLMGALGVA